MGYVIVPWRGTTYKLLYLVGGWTNPFEKYAQVKMGFIFPKFPGENKTYLSCHHLENNGGKKKQHNSWNGCIFCSEEKFAPIALVELVRSIVTTPKNWKSQVIWESRKFSLSTGKVQFGSQWIRGIQYIQKRSKKKHPKPLGFLKPIHGIWAICCALIGPQKIIYPPWNWHSPWKWWFPIGISFSRGLFSGARLVSGRVLVGGFNPFENYARQNGFIFPQFFGVEKKYIHIYIYIFETTVWLLLYVNGRTKAASETSPIATVSCWVPPTAFSLFKAAMVQSLRRWKLDILYSRCLKNNPEKNPWVFSGIFKQIQKNLQIFFATDFFFRSRDGSKWHLNHSTFFNFQAFPWARRLSPLNLFRGFPPRTKGIACGGFGGRRSWSYVHRNGKWRGKLKLQVINVFMARKKGWHAGNRPYCESRTSGESKVTAIFGNVLASVPNRFARLFLCSCFLQYLAKCQTQCHLLHRTGESVQLHRNLANFCPSHPFSPHRNHTTWILPSPTVGLKFEPPKTCIIFFPKKNNTPRLLPSTILADHSRIHRRSTVETHRHPGEEWEMWKFEVVGHQK